MMAALFCTTGKLRRTQSFRLLPYHVVLRPRLTTVYAVQPKNYYLLKSEPDEFSIQDLQRCQESVWDGIRSFQARNKLRRMKNGDLAFFYHSSCKVPGIVGIMRVTEEASPDPAALDPNHKGYDPKSTEENCRWDIIRVGFESIFEHPVTLSRLKTVAQEDDILADMILFRQSRLSVQEVSPEQWNRIMEMSMEAVEEEVTSTKKPSKSSTAVTKKSSTKSTSKSTTKAPSKVSPQVTSKSSTTTTSELSTKSASKTSSKATAKASTKLPSKSSTKVPSKSSSTAKVASKRSTRVASKTSTKVISEATTKEESNSSKDGPSSTARRRKKRAS